MNKKISVIIPAYNIQDYILDCLNSVKNQTYQNLEIFIIDDGSNDKTSRYCDEFVKTEPRATVIHQKNQGLSEARNVGIKHSKSEYIVFIDGDDKVAPEFIEKLVAEQERVNADIVVCGFEMSPSSKQELPQKHTLSGKEATIKLLLELNNYQIVSWNKLYKKALFEETKFPIGKKHEDSLTTYKLFSQAKTVSFIDEPLYYYIQRKDSIMGSEKIHDLLTAKLSAAKEAKNYLKHDEDFIDAANISELLAYYSFLDNIYSGRLKDDPERYRAIINKNKKQLYKNQFLSKKLKTYIMMSTKMGGLPYKLFRKIIHD